MNNTTAGFWARVYTSIRGAEYQFIQTALDWAHSQNKTNINPEYKEAIVQLINALMNVRRFL